MLGRGWRWCEGDAWSTDGDTDEPDSAYGIDDEYDMSLDCGMEGGLLMLLLLCELVALVAVLVGVTLFIHTALLCSSYVPPDDPPPPYVYEPDIHEPLPTHAIHTIQIYACTYQFHFASSCTSNDANTVMSSQ